MTIEETTSERTRAALDWLKEYGERERDLAAAVGFVTLRASDVEFGLALLLEAVLGRRSVLATQSAPATKRIEWLSQVSQDRSVCTAATGEGLRATLKRTRMALQARNRIVHAMWIQLPDNRFGQLSMAKAGGSLDGKAIELASLEQVADELQECAGLLRDAHRRLEGEWGDSHAPLAANDLDSGMRLEDLIDD